jgi:hypothetical protein
VVKEVASLGMVVVMALLLLAFISTLRPSAIAAVQGDKVIDVAPRKHTFPPRPAVAAPVSGTLQRQ